MIEHCRRIPEARYKQDAHSAVTKFGSELINYLVGPHIPRNHDPRPTSRRRRRLQNGAAAQHHRILHSVTSNLASACSSSSRLYRQYKLPSPSPSMRCPIAMLISSSSYSSIHVWRCRVVSIVIHPWIWAPCCRAQVLVISVNSVGSGVIGCCILLR